MSQGRSIVLYLPKIQTAAEAAYWNLLLDTLEDHLGLQRGTILCYVLVEQIEACFQLMEIRAALGRHFVGFNTGRWDYINSVSDAYAWDPGFINPNIDAITMTYGYMRDLRGSGAPGGEHTGPERQLCAVAGRDGAEHPGRQRGGCEAAMKKAVAGGEREQREGASGKWVAHWKMVHIMRPVWERIGPGQPAGPGVPGADLHRRGRATG